jgi:hypothetical protein
MASAREANHGLAWPPVASSKRSTPAALFGMASRFADLAALEAAVWDWQNDDA